MPAEPRRSNGASVTSLDGSDVTFFTSARFFHVTHKHTHRATQLSQLEHRVPFFCSQPNVIQFISILNLTSVTLLMTFCHISSALLTAKLCIFTNSALHTITPPLLQVMNGCQFFHFCLSGMQLQKYGC